MPLSHKLRRQRLCRGLRVSVHRRVDDQHALRFRLIAAPQVIFLNKIRQIITPNRIVERTDMRI